MEDKTKDVLLSLMERLTLLNIIPEKGNILTLKLYRKLRESLGNTEQEIKDWDIQYIPQEDGKVSIVWDREKTKEKRFIFSSVQLKIIREQLDRLDKADSMTIDQLKVYEKLFE